MSDRQEIEQELQEKLDAGESAYNKMKAKLDAAGDEASDEARQALHKAGEMLDKGKAKMKQLADASDDEFDHLWAETKEEWHEIKSAASDGWSKLTHSVRDFFA